MASPADLVKVHVQMEGKRRLMGLKPRVHSSADALKQILKRGGVKALWKGSIPNVYRAALVNLGDLTTYDFAKRNIMEKTKLPDCHTVHIMASICAGLVAATMGTPMDVIKTRIMNQPTDEKGRCVSNQKLVCVIEIQVLFLLITKNFHLFYIAGASYTKIHWIASDKQSAKKDSLHYTKVFFQFGYEWLRGL